MFARSRDNRADRVTIGDVLSSSIRPVENGIKGHAELRRVLAERIAKRRV